jgi:hypothetical protein
MVEMDLTALSPSKKHGSEYETGVAEQSGGAEPPPRAAVSELPW